MAVLQPNMSIMANGSAEEISEVLLVSQPTIPVCIVGIRRTLSESNVSWLLCAVYWTWLNSRMTNDGIAG